MILLNWGRFKPKYSYIKKELSFDESRDLKSAEELEKIIRKSNIEALKNKISSKECVIFGAGPSLEKDLKKLDEEKWKEKVWITADGSTTLVKKYKLPEVIVTDLDGKVEDQIKCWKDGSWLVIHAHGDNIDKIKGLEQGLENKVLGTKQVGESNKIHNFGGFTDGDRAIFMAHELEAEKIYLAGMDLGKEIGEYTGKTNPEKKRKKLEICKDLITWLKQKTGVDIVNLTTNGEKIPKIPEVEKI